MAPGSRAGNSQNSQEWPLAYGQPNSAKIANRIAGSPGQVTPLSLLRHARSELGRDSGRLVLWPKGHPVILRNTQQRSLPPGGVSIPQFATPADGIAMSTHPGEDLCVRPKGPPGASRGVRSGYSIPMGRGAVGLPRSSFVLRRCICKVDEARGKACAWPRPCGYKIL